jgi:hypothetical protein
MILAVDLLLLYPAFPILIRHLPDDLVLATAIGGFHDSTLLWRLGNSA